MQENRAFDHYFGTMAGVRGFKDPNVHISNNTNKPIWYQPTTSTVAEYLLPWWLTENPQYTDSTQCMIAGSNDWTPNHNSWDNGEVDGWVVNNTAWSWGHFRRSDLPVHFGIAEGWTIADMYAESVIGPTNPNRVSWASGTINFEGSPPGDPEVNGGPYIENYELPGCESNGDVKYACYPLKWKTTPEYLEANNISWFVYQDVDNFDDNPFAHFEQYQTSSLWSDLRKKGLSYAGIDKFYSDCQSNSLPQVSYIIGPMELSEHPPFQPKDGAWLQKKIVDEFVNSPSYNNSVLFIMYDETGGLADHVEPFVSPRGTIGEWAFDPEDTTSYIPSGPGFRVPFYAISPYTRGSKVFTEPSDHSSQILFIEEWAKQALNISFTSTDMNVWRREHMSNLVNMFDFDHPNYTLPSIPEAETPSTLLGVYDGMAKCVLKYALLEDRRPPVPYGNQTEETSLWTESGYKEVCGKLTEGRYLVFEQIIGDSAYTLFRNTSSDALDCIVPLTGGYKSATQRFILHQIGDAFSTEFHIEAYGKSPVYLVDNTAFVKSLSKADAYTIDFIPGLGYTIQSSSGLYLSALASGTAKFKNSVSYWNIYSVTY
ncbi:phosphoesterase family-domain-containing protein [Lipomyces oligophaga]|uniref:phosphoesterase family-domain-containing protein n=1 Tax=Lipomyces oligophaga TaxID=45792 RepID=UPI0034CFC895